MFNLFLPYYNDDCVGRQKELDFCLKHNCLNPMIENIFLFPESRKDKIPILSEKVHIVHLERRITYKDLVNHIDNIVDSYRYYNIIMNTDIFFDNTLNFVKTIDMTNTCLALTRWEVNIEKINEPYIYMTHESQDVWIFKGYINMNIDCDFYLGIAGCEGRFNFELTRIGYKVYNPSRDIKVLHYHMTNKRNWSEDTRLQGDSINPPIINIKDMRNGN